MNILETNRKSLKKHHPTLWKELEATCSESRKTSAEENFGVVAEFAKDGNAIDIIVKGPQKVCMQSKYHPIEEATRFSAQYYDAKADSCFLFLGFGNGYVVRQLMKQKDNTFVFYEPSKEYFIYVLERYDIADILACPNVHIYVVGLNEKYMSLDMYRYVHAMNWHSFFLECLPKYQQLWPEVLLQLDKVHGNTVLHAKQNYDVAIKAAKANFHNAIRNLAYIYRGDSICQFDGILADEIPVIVVAAGPSLEKNVDELKWLRSHAFILAVDRAAPVLADHGIQPHAYVTTDAKKEIELFEPDGLGDIPWFLYTTSHYEAIQKLGCPRLIFASTIYGYAEKLFSICGSDLFTLANGGSVSTVAVNIAIHLGSKRIILVGQDLALTDEKIHAGEDHIDLHQAGYSLIPVAGFYGGQVYTREDYKAYLDWYEAYVTHHPEIAFVNATEGGAYIEGMEHLSLENAVNKYGVESMDGDLIMENVPALMTRDNQEKLWKEYQGLLSYMKNVKREVGTAITQVEHGLEVLGKSGFTHPDLNGVEKAIDRFQTLYNSHPGNSLINLNIAKSVQEALLDIQFTKDDPTEELQRLYSKMLLYFKDIALTVAEAIPMLQQVLAEIENK